MESLSRTLTRCKLFVLTASNSGKFTGNESLDAIVVDDEPPTVDEISNAYFARVRHSMTDTKSIHLCE